MTEFECIGEYSLAICIGLALALAAVCWWLYHAHLRDAPALHRWLLPSLRSLAIVLCLLMLAGPTLRHRAWQGNPSHVTMLLDATSSMRWNDADPADGDPAPSRFARAARFVLAENGRLLRDLSDRSEIAVSRFAGSQTVPLWASSLAESHPLPQSADAWIPQEWLSPTALGDLIAGIGSPRDVADRAAADGKSDEDPAEGTSDASIDALVLFTDGRTNAGISPLESARQLAARKQKLFVVGYGNLQEPYDLAITSVQCPERLLKTDLLRGTLSWKEQVPAGQPLKLCIRAGDKLLWEQTVTSQQQQRQSAEFAIPVHELPAGPDNNQRGVAVSEQTVALRATIESGLDAAATAAERSTAVLPAETDATNNERSFHVRVVTRQYRVLILDGRARWETRYLRNALERDPNWRVEAHILDPTEGPRPFSDAGAERPMPQTLEDLLPYDLLVLGELPIDAVSAAWLGDLSRYVGDSGGGLLVVDGSHGLLRDAAWHSLHSLLPVQWVSARSSASQSSASQSGASRSGASRSGQLPSPTPLQLTAAGEALEALRLESDPTADQSRVWRELPGISFAAQVRANPGSETLLTLAGESSSPVLVTQRYGAGRVLYLATDQTWRWRYAVADRYHQRWWNQIARWAMRMPFAVENEFLQLTTDRPQYGASDAMLVTARLRDPQGKGVSSGDVQVICRGRDDPARVVQSISMQPDESIAGLYRATVTGLPAGAYDVSVSAAGIPDRSLALSCPVAVVAEDDPEMQELSCNESLLRELAQATGGTYLHEESAEQLLDLLLPLSRAQAVESQTALAKSYLWFVPIVLLLGAEWWLRKRAGLL